MGQSRQTVGTPSAVEVLISLEFLGTVLQLL